MWKSRGPSGTICGKAYGPSGFWPWNSLGTIFTRIPQKGFFHILPFFRNPALVTGILLQPILPLGSILVNTPLGFYNIDSVNPSKLRRDLERMSDVTDTNFLL